MEKLQQAFITPGAIVHIYCPHLRNPKNKFVVIAHIDADDDLALGFFINSEVHFLIRSDPDRLACQIELPAAHPYTFLDHDSYLDCSKVQEQFSCSELVDHITHNPQEYKGHLDEAEIESLIDAVQRARTISGYDKNLIIASIAKRGK